MTAGNAGERTACHVFSQVPWERWPSRAWSPRPSTRWRCRPSTARVKAKAAPPTSSAPSPSVSGTGFILGSTPEELQQASWLCLYQSVTWSRACLGGGKKNLLIPFTDRGRKRERGRKKHLRRKDFARCRAAANKSAVMPLRRRHNGFQDSSLSVCPCWFVKKWDWPQPLTQLHFFPSI